MKPTQLTEQSLARAAKTLAGRDPDLAAILERLGPPPLWARPPGFATLVRIILEQQVSLASAASMFARLKQNTIRFTPARVLELGETHLKSLGLTRQKTSYCLHLAESLRDKRLRLSRLPLMTDAEVKSALMGIKGLGSWSADVYLLMVLRRPDIWPAGDLALATAALSVKRLQQRPTPEVLTKLAEPWRPFRSVAARMLWQHYLARSTEAR
ncbi:MAG: DNA-3-methyladenine glycosylase family protein [Pyrinomonadaceae bacterium]